MMTPGTTGLGLATGVQAAGGPAEDGHAPPAAIIQPGTSPPDNIDTPAMTDIHDIKPLLDIEADWMGLLYPAGGFVALLLLLVLAWWLWRRRRSAESAPMKPLEIAPDKEALSALDALAAENGLTPKHYYFRLSAILRHYVARRFHLPAAEMTTEELLPRVDRLPMERSLATALKDFFRAADPIKFAGVAARQDQVNQNLAFCRDFIHRTTEAAQEGGV